MTTTAQPSPPDHWDPTAAPYVTRECRARRHHNCARGLIWYPAGVDGDPVDVPCVCDADGCLCAKNATKGAAG